MPEPIENYIPQNLAEHFRRQAYRVWLVGAVIVTGWVLLIVLPTIVPTTFAGPLYNFFSYICHQQSERSFHLLGHQFGVCSRCFGVYFGLLLGFAIYPLWRDLTEVEPPPRFWLFLSLIPISIDWSLGVFGIWENNHFSRFITGMILGVACGTYIVPAIIDIARNVSRRSFREEHRRLRRPG